MKNFLLSNWKIILVVVVVIILLIFVYKKGRKWVPKQVKLPPDTQPGGAINFNPGTYTDAIFKDIDCVFCTHKIKPYADLNALSNSQLVAVYNDWNQRYFSEYNETIVQAMSGELSFLGYTWAQTVKLVIERYKSINLN